MNLRKTWFAAALLSLVTCFGPTEALAANRSPTPRSASTLDQVSAAHRQPRASLSVRLDRSRAWVGQQVPITISARFRDVEGVTLDGVPQIKSESVFTTNVARDPRQTTEIVNGEPVLVATWSGTLTPSTAGALALSVELPVRIRYREAVPNAVRRPAERPDPFQDFFDPDPFGRMRMNDMFRAFRDSLPDMLDEPLMVRVREAALPLKASARPLDVEELPASGRPSDFSGAVGKFTMQAALNAPSGSVSQPITLTVTVRGQGDLDRVKIAGLQTSPAFKAYPISAKQPAASSASAKSERTFEQVIVPLRTGELEIPPLELANFDPSVGRYTRVATNALSVNVAAAPPSAEPATQAVTASAAQTPREGVQQPTQEPRDSVAPPAASELIDGWWSMAARLAPVFVIILAAALFRLWRHRDAERSLKRALRHAARDGSATRFFDTAQRLILLHFAKRWRRPESKVTVQVLRDELGEGADPLVCALTTADALRFGRADLSGAELTSLCTSIEASLRSAS
jgi:hypothetical protein